jgi:hypothetical protein
MPCLSPRPSTDSSGMPWLSSRQAKGVFILKRRFSMLELITLKFQQIRASLKISKKSIFKISPFQPNPERHSGR